MELLLNNKMEGKKKGKTITIKIELAHFDLQRRIDKIIIKENEVLFISYYGLYKEEINK